MQKLQEICLFQLEWGLKLGSGVAEDNKDMTQDLVTWRIIRSWALNEKQVTLDRTTWLLHQNLHLFVRPSFSDLANSPQVGGCLLVPCHAAHGFLCIQQLAQHSAGVNLFNPHSEYCYNSHFMVQEMEAPRVKQFAHVPVLVTSRELALLLHIFHRVFSCGAHYGMPAGPWWGAGHLRYGHIRSPHIKESTV